MAIEAVTAIKPDTAGEIREALRSRSAAPMEPARSENDLALNVSPQPRPEASFAEGMATRVYDAIDRVGVDLPAFKPTADTQIDREKAAMSPASQDISAGAQAANPGEYGQEMISRAFDHAVFMASVNQVLSGVSDTARTLVRQQ
jgi:hypothetical protein